MQLDAQQKAKYTRNALLGCFGAELIAGLATMMYSVCLTTIKTELGLTAVQAGSLATWTFLGQMLGGMFIGYLADIVGRKWALVIDLICAAGAVFLTSFATGYATFAVLRFITGVGLGGCYYISAILIGEWVSTEKRGLMASIATACWNFGYVIICFFTTGIVNGLGWRTSFQVCAIPGLMVFFLIFCVKDAPSFLAGKERTNKRIEEGTKKNAYAEIWNNPVTRKPLILWGLNMILYFYGYYGFISWLPAYIQGKVQFEKAGWFTAAAYIAMVIGTVIGGKLADKIGRKTTLAIGCIGTAAAGLLLSFIVNQNNCLPLMLCYGILYGMPTGFHSTAIGESFPAHLRTTGTGFSFNIGRIGAFTAPLVIGAFVDAGQISIGIATMTIAYVLSVVAIIPIKEKAYDAQSTEE